MKVISPNEKLVVKQGSGATLTRDFEESQECQIRLCKTYAVLVNAERIAIGKPNNSNERHNQFSLVNTAMPQAIPIEPSSLTISSLYVASVPKR